MQKYLLLIFFICVCSSAYTQTNFKKDYKILDSITRNYKTYNIKLITKDTVVSFPYGHQSVVMKAFKFLKKKKYSDKKPDFTINVLMQDIKLQYPSYSIENLQKSGIDPKDRKIYKVNTYYSLSITMETIINNVSQYNNLIVSNKQYAKVFYWPFPDPNYDMGRQYTDVNTVIEKLYQEYTIRLLSLIEDLEEALLDYIQ